MRLAGEYAYAGRDFVVDKVLDIPGTEAIHEVHNHHNYRVALPTPTTRGGRSTSAAPTG
jgi:hypothetical protein